MTDATSLAINLLKRLDAALLAYAPIAAGISFMAHSVMVEVARNFATMALADLRVVNEHFDML